MLRSVTLMCMIALSSLAGLPASAKTALGTALIAKLDGPIDSNRQTRPNQLYFAQVVSSQDSNLPLGTVLGGQISEVVYTLRPLDPQTTLCI